MQESLLDQGITLMLVGMGTVFVFLTLLVATMTVMSRIAIRFSNIPVSGEISDEEVAAISVAIAQYRNKN